MRLSQCSIAIHVHERIDLRIQPPDAFEMSLGQNCRAYFASPHRCRHVGRGKRSQAFAALLGMFAHDVSAERCKAFSLARISHEGWAKRERVANTTGGCRRLTSRGSAASHSFWHTRWHTFSSCAIMP